MRERVVPGRTGGLISSGAAGALWAALTADSTVPTASAVLACSPADARAGYVLLGSRVVAMVKTTDGTWRVPEAEVRRAAAELNAVEMDDQDLIRIGPFRSASMQDRDEGTLMRWRQRISRELQELGGPGPAAHSEGGWTSHLAGIDWQRILVQQIRDRTQRSWWLPRAVVRLLDAAEHAETQWLQAAQARQTSTAAARPPSHQQVRSADSRQTSTDDPPARPRPYNGELQGQLYTVLSRKPGASRTAAGWICAVCRTASAAVLDHCHEHGYVRAPVCQSCNTQERPDHLYSNDIRVAGRYTRLFDTDTAGWLRHWHRCPGCRARTTLPLPHLAAWTAHVACRSLRPTHRDARSSRARKPCGVLRASWTGSQNTPRSCLLTVTVDFCPSGEHRVLAQVPYREAAERFGTWLAETAPDVAAAAGPDRTDGLPARLRPVIADTSSEGQALF
ncbi:endonuclease domain-containing protein [Streptomyces chartreusis]|uniref:endonuclease domain-containing protein n=1 Tax=Streptomyces chartreusis TaxID=1969 RepID=UPI002F9175BC|nr:endonuclease VII domain-containing protein [Streptomyces chartreusis]WSZ73451.1 endonuclease VII domain-containing protein [Streptomyces chartreusis]WTA33295.1 endonuclease VII domain-containing protein [Streptomyces chartreusis]WTA33709.1 endonuclease VII domain-containing protein [Streptomyces chartreusis]